MRIRRTDLEMIAGSKESITYEKYDVQLDDENKPISETLGAFGATDTITLTVKVNKEDTTNVLQKTATITDGKAVFTLASSDTVNLDEGTYIYDVFWQEVGSDPICLVPPSNFTIVQSVNFTPTGS